MARYGKDERIHRISDRTAVIRGLARFGFATILLLGALIVSLAAAPQASHLPRDTARVTRYLIVSGDSSSGSWDSRDEPRIEEWRSRYGSHFAWFRQDGRDYIVNDDRRLAELQHAMAPQLEVNRRQEEVNRHQEDVNRLQEGVNSHQEGVNRAQAEGNRQQDLVNRGNAAQSHVNQIQSDVNAKQQGVNAEQDKVNQRQALVNKEQEAVNQMQARATVEIEKALQTVFDSARKQGLAQEAR
jgi:hypothetical protein